MHKIEILANDLKSLLLLKNLRLNSHKAKISALSKFNFDTSYKYKEQNFDCGYHAIEKSCCLRFGTLSNLPLKLREFKVQVFIF